MDLIPKNHLAFVVKKNQLWICGTTCGLQSRTDLNLIKVNEIKDKTYTISFALEQNRTRRGHTLATGSTCSTLLRTPGADLKRDVIEAIDM